MAKARRSVVAASRASLMRRRETPAMVWRAVGVFIIVK